MIALDSDEAYCSRAVVSRGTLGSMTVVSSGTMGSMAVLSSGTKGSRDSDDVSDMRLRLFHLRSLV